MLIYRSVVLSAYNNLMGKGPTLSPVQVHEHFSAKDRTKQTLFKNSIEWSTGIWRFAI
jgi:hypothetical protein